MEVRKRRSLQFRLSQLFVAVTAFAVVFAVGRAWGLAGIVGTFQAALFVGGACALVAECHEAIKEHLGW